MALNSHTEYGEVDFATHRVADRTDFLEKMFPISNEMINRILNKVAESGDYKNDCWFPVSEENTLGQCFVKAANAIHSAAIASRNDSNEAVAGAKWMEYSSARQAGDMPVILARRQAQAQCDIDILPKSDHNDEGDSSNHQLFSWLQALAAVEMRRKASQNDGEMVTQLLGHLRRIMQKQLDRRFVFGLAVEPAHITVWLYDRSGAIGTSESVDIHQNPKDFIHVMAGFALLPMHQLGFDTTMRFYASPNNVFHTFDLDAGGLRVYLDTASTEKQWVITCNDGRQYLTVRVLCLNSHCLVWVVVPFGSGEITSNDLRVLKQYWRLDHPNTMSERELLVETFGDNVSGRIEFEETVKINGEEDITATLIRHDIQVAMPASSEDKNLRRAWDDDSKSYYLTRIRGLGYWDDMSCVQATPIGPMARIHTRVMQTIFGWPLDTFKTLRELVQGALDVVIDHATLYNKGLLHRDISSGNILLTWCNGTSGTTGLGTQGRLIDFDRSRRGEKLAEGLLPDVNSDVAQTVVSILPLTLHQDDGIRHIDRSVANRVLEVMTFDETTSYVNGVVRHMKKYRPVDERVSLITTDMLLWKPTTFPRYRFDSTELQRGSRTGTLPFTSAEILSSERYFTSPVRFFHDAIHDMESVLWVLSYIGMTRSGPGKRREVGPATGEQKDPDHKSLPTAIYHLFEGTQDEVKRRKLVIFRNPKDYKTDVTGHFHAYFAALKPFMEEWFDLLVLAYKHVKGHEYRSIHYQIEHILRRALESLPPDDEATQKEVMESRLKDLEGMVQLGAEAQCTREDAGMTRAHDLAFRSQTYGQHLDPPPSTSSPPPRKKAKI